MEYVYLLISAYGLFVIFVPKYGPHYGNILNGKYARHRFGIDDHTKLSLLVSRILGVFIFIIGLVFYLTSYGVN